MTNRNEFKELDEIFAEPRVSPLETFYPHSPIKQNPSRINVPNAPRMPRHRRFLTPLPPFPFLYTPRRNLEDVFKANDEKNLKGLKRLERKYRRERKKAEAEAEARERERKRMWPKVKQVLGIRTAFLEALAPDVKSSSSAELKYAAQLFQDAVQMLGAVPANPTSTNYGDYFNLNSQQQTGREVAYELIKKLAKFTKNAEGTDRIIRDAAIGLVVGAGVCDTYASLVAVLAVLMPGPTANKPIYVESVSGHTKPYVYDILIDVHAELGFRQCELRVPDTTNVENLSNENPDDVYQKLQTDMRKLSELAVDVEGKLTPENKHAYNAFINMGRDDSLTIPNSLTSRLDVFQKFEVKRKVRKELKVEFENKFKFKPGRGGRACTNYINQNLESRLKMIAAAPNP